MLRHNSKFHFGQLARGPELHVAQWPCHVEAHSQGTHHHTHKLLSLLLISLHVKPFICPPSQPLGAVTDHRCFSILLVCKIVTSEVLMQPISSSLSLVVEFMHPAKSFSVGTLPLASESPYVYAESNYSIWGKLMKVDLELL
jgi:hypothetical protein